MKKDRIIAVIDIGSHAIKLHVGEIKRKNMIRQIEYLWIPVAIGKDTFTKGIISNTTINEAISVVKKFKEVIDSFQVVQYKAIASSSIREASNVDVMIERVNKATGIKIEVVEPIEETEVIYLGIKNLLQDRYGLDENNTLFFSIGGGSTQIVLQSKGRIIFSETHHIGTLKIIKDFDFSEKSYQMTLQPFSQSFLTRVGRFPDVQNIDSFVAVNDDVLALIQKCYPEYLINGVYKIPKKDFIKLSLQIDTLSLDSIKEKYQLNEAVIKTTKVAILMLGIFYHLTSAKFILIPDLSSSYFMLYKMAFLDTDRYGFTDHVVDNILSSAMAIGNKYHYDERHAKQVTRLALLIFDKMAETYAFTSRERIYLEVAGLLHDIGAFINASSHNKHSAQLILSSEIMGLQEKDMKMIALIARYHRKSTPKPSHSEYIELAMEDRLIVSRLSSILRIADALDNTHSQIVEGLNLNLDGEKCEITLKLLNENYQYMDILRAAVKKKSDLFESFFGVPIRLERKS